MPPFETVPINSNSKDAESSPWAKSSVSNLVRYVPSGIYFARAKVGGKLIRRSLKADKLSVAQFRLNDLLKLEHGQLEARVAAGKGKMTFGEALGIYQKQLEANVSLKPSAKIYRPKCVEALLRSRPGLSEKDIRKISERECVHWASRFGKSGTRQGGIHNG